MLRINKPSTVYVSFLKRPNNLFTVYDSNNKEYSKRYLSGNEKGIKVNIPDKGIYYFSEDCISKIKPLEINQNINRISLPAKERNRFKKYKIIHDETETRSPALIYTKIGIIVTGRNFNNYSKVIQQFLINHEIGHFYYGLNDEEETEASKYDKNNIPAWLKRKILQSEKHCDLFALIKTVKQGYNISNCMYCLTDILRHKPQNDERIEYIFNQIVKADLIN